MIPYFEDLGNRIASAWSGRTEDLCQVALDALEAQPACEHTSMTQVLQWVSQVANEDYVPQRDPGMAFAEPPVTVFRHAAFCIDVNFWGTSSTQIHEHAFSGAFQILHGASLQSRYRFDSRRVINPRMALGQLDFVDAKRLDPGDTQAIWPGSGLIHALFHLAMPSATVVVRTYGDAALLPQRSFDPPGLATDGHFRGNAVEQRRVQLVRFLATADVENGQHHLLEILANCHPVVFYNLMSDELPAFWMGRGATAQSLDDAVVGAFEMAPLPDEELHRALREAARRRVSHRFHLGLRYRLTDETDLEVVAALLCAPNRAAVERCLVSMRPDVPAVQRVTALAEKLGELEDGAPIGTLEAQGPSSLYRAWFAD